MYETGPSSYDGSSCFHLVSFISLSPTYPYSFHVQYAVNWLKRTFCPSPNPINLTPIRHPPISSLAMRPPSKSHPIHMPPTLQSLPTTMCSQHQSAPMDLKPESYRVNLMASLLFPFSLSTQEFRQPSSTLITLTLSTSSVQYRPSLLSRLNLLVLTTVGSFRFGKTPLITISKFLFSTLKPILPITPSLPD